MALRAVRRIRGAPSHGLRETSANLSEPVNKIVVFLARTDPEPCNDITVATCYGTIVISDSGRPNVSAERLELHGWMKWIAHPDLKLVAGEALDVPWQSIEFIPESPMRSGFHGISRSRPALMSSSTSRRTLSRSPLPMSRFICSSQSSSFQPCSHAASSARCSNGSCAIAVLISARLTRRSYHRPIALPSSSNAAGKVSIVSPDPHSRSIPYCFVAGSVSGHLDCPILAGRPISRTTLADQKEWLPETFLPFAGRSICWS